MENSIFVSSVPSCVSGEHICLQAWFEENVCDVLVHETCDGSPIIVEILLEGFVDVALHRFIEAGGSARLPSSDEWQEARGKAAAAEGLRILEITLASHHGMAIELPVASGGGTGMRLWPSSLVLAEWLLQASTGRDLLCNRSVIELGAGAAALPSVAAHVLGAKQIVASDGIGAVVTQLNLNLERWGYAQHIKTRIIKWEKMPVKLRSFDVVMFADTVYSKRGAFFLADAVQRCMSKTGAIIGAVQCRGGVWDDFMADMAWRDCEAQEMHVSDDVRRAAEFHMRSDVDSPGTRTDVHGVRIWIWQSSSKDSRNRCIDANHDDSAHASS